MKDIAWKAATSLVLILLVALGARWGFAWNQERKIPRQALATAPFEQETGSIAHALATGKGFSNPFLRDTGPTAWLTPVYPLIVAATFKIFGIFTIPAFLFLVSLNSIFSAAVCVPIYYIGKHVAGVGVGSAAAWLWAVFPSAVMMPFEWIWDTSLTAFLAATLLWATLTLAESGRWRDWCWYGLLWGFTLMTNPAVGSLLPLLLAWAAYRSRKQTTSDHLAACVNKAALAFGLAILCCVPWTIRNYVVFHRFVPLRSNFPLELYIGNNENYDDKRPRWPPPITKERETVRYFRMGETAFMDEEKRKAMKFILAHPRMEATLIGDRFIAFWTGVPNPVTTFPNAEPIVQALILCAALSGVAALCGIVVLVWRRSTHAFPLASYPLVFPMLYYVTHTSVRYRHPIDPVVLVLTAIALAAVAQSLLRLRAAKTDDSASGSTQARAGGSVRPNLHYDQESCGALPGLTLTREAARCAPETSPRRV
jgi:hypothetical protein